MIDFIIMITVIIVGVYLFLFLQALKEDLKDINDDVENLIVRIEKIEKIQVKNKQRKDISGEEYLGI
tara:strand:+ start:89 stop:289 length:201 start_codon:yes stop_codon:yes gene_type:complete